MISKALWRTKRLFVEIVRCLEIYIIAQTMVRAAGAGRSIAREAHGSQPAVSGNRLGVPERLRILWTIKRRSSVTQGSGPNPVRVRNTRSGSDTCSGSKDRTGFGPDPCATANAAVLGKSELAKAMIDAFLKEAKQSIDTFI
jgi:hypothetical protein